MEYTRDKIPIDDWKIPGPPSPKKIKVNQSVKKKLLEVFFDARGVILTHTVPLGQTVDAICNTKGHWTCFIKYWT